jgi:hypothetical protein
MDGDVLICGMRSPLQVGVAEATADREEEKMLSIL